MKPLRVLDLFCGLGGAAMGIHRAAEAIGRPIEIIGVDLHAHPDYPFKHRQRDISTFTPATIEKMKVDFIWSSPPCQSFSYAAARWINAGKSYPDLVDFTRNLLMTSGKPWVMENVIGSPLRKYLILCGVMFGLKTIRHRVFEISGFYCPRLPHKPHKGSVSAGDYVTCAGHGGNGKNSLGSFKEAMQIDWSNDKDAISQAVPPAYSKYIFGAFLQRKQSSLLSLK